MDILTQPEFEACFNLRFVVLLNVCSALTKDFTAVFYQKEHDLR